MRRGARRLASAALAVAAVGAIAVWISMPRRDASPVAPDAATGTRGDAEPALAARGASASTTRVTDAPSGSIRYAPIDPARKGIGSVRLRVVRAAERADGDDLPVAGAAVVLRGLGHGSEAIRVSATSGPDGSVQLSEVPAGPWLTLDVRVAGDAPVVRADVDVERGRMTDLGDVRVGVRRALRVSVIGEDAQPVAAARVDVEPVAEADVSSVLSHGDPGAVFRWIAERRATTSGVTDAQGLSVVPGLAPGSWLVTASAPNRVPSRAIIEVPSTADPADVELCLRPSVSVRGRLVDSDGRAVGGGRLLASSVDGALPQPSIAVPRWSTTDAEGRFEMALAPGAFPCGLWAQADGLPLTWARLDAPRDDLEIAFPAAVSFCVRAKDDETGAGIVGAAVAIGVDDGRSHPPSRWWTRAPEGAWIARGTTDASGEFRTAVPAGRLVDLSLDAPGYRSARLAGGGGDPTFETAQAERDLRAATPACVVARMTLWPGQRRDSSGHVAVPLRAAVDSEALVTIRGRVLDEAGAPIASASLRLAQDTVGTSSADGRFVLSVAEGDLRRGESRVIYVRARGHDRGRSEEFKMPAAGAVDVGDITLPRGAAVEGVVREALGAPAPGVRVVMKPATFMTPPGILPEDVFLAVTDAEGRFRFTGVHAPYWGEVALEPARGTAVGTTTWFELKEGETARELSLRLGDGVPLEGDVVDERGEVVANARVVFLADTGGTEMGGADSPSPARTRADSRGHFRFRAVTSGAAWVGAYAPHRETEVHIESPPRGPLRIVVEPPRREGDGATDPTRLHTWDYAFDPSPRDGGVEVPEDSVR